MFKLIAGIICCTSLLVGCRTSNQMSEWIDGQWNYNSEQTLQRTHNLNGVDKTSLRKIEDIESELADNYLSVSRERSHFKYLNFDIKFETINQSENYVIFQASGEEFEMLVAKRIDKNRIEITIISELPAGLQTQLIGVFDKAQ